LIHVALAAAPVLAEPAFRVLPRREKEQWNRNDPGVSWTRFVGVRGAGPDHRVGTTAAAEKGMDHVARHP